VVHPPAPVVAPEAEAETATLALYFANPKATGFVLERRQVRLAPGEDRLARALAELARGPEIAGAAPLLPEGAEAPSAFRAGKTVFLDLPAAYRSLGYGVRGESLLLYGLANTALANSDAEEVRFLLDGKPAIALIHLSLADPIRRKR
jgi:spore germination protein GerM